MTPREYLASLEFHGIKLGLDNIRFLCEAAGNPHLAHPVVHVAGTNGKGSVLAFLDAMLRAAGYSTGRYTSPHLLDVSERFLVNAKPIGEAELDGEVEYFRRIAGTMAHPPTYFELATAVAFRWFASQPLDVALIEVGMGGRFDSTNVVEPAVTCITNIDLEHTRYLGDTLEKIAFEKAGIIKPNAPVVLAETNPGPRDVILARAEELGAPVRLLGRDFDFRTNGPNLDLSLTYESDTLRVEPARLGLPGRYQGVNAAVAVAVADALRERFPNLNENTMRRGLEAAKWPCRLERFHIAPAEAHSSARTVVIDVAHNAAGARRLAEELPECVVVLAVSSDKAADKMIESLAPVARRLILTQFSGTRALSLDALCQAVGAYEHIAIPTLEEAIEAGLALATEDCPLVITGSIFTAGEARRILIESYGAPELEF